MSVQFGFLAYLVWWEYDWDIMEPVTYFVATGTSIVLFSYFLLTRQVSWYSSMSNKLTGLSFFSVNVVNLMMYR